MSSELEKLYGNLGIDLKEIQELGTAKSEEILYRVVKKEVVVGEQKELQYIIETINISQFSQENIEQELLVKNLLRTPEEAKAYLKYVTILDRVVATAIGVNIADNNYKPNYKDEDSRIYVINYNERTQSMGYDYVYTIPIAYIDYRLSFRTQTIAENFINSLNSDLKYLNKYRIADLRGDDLTSL